MLAGVGCKDYDDDIDKVNGRLDQLETGKLASVEQQIAAINSSISSLEAAYKAADAELKSALENRLRIWLQRRAHSKLRSSR